VIKLRHAKRIVVPLFKVIHYQHIYIMHGSSSTNTVVVTGSCGLPEWIAVKETLESVTSLTQSHLMVTSDMDISGTSST